MSRVTGEKASPVPIRGGGVAEVGWTRRQFFIGAAAAVGAGFARPVARAPRPVVLILCPEQSRTAAARRWRGARRLAGSRGSGGRRPPFQARNPRRAAARAASLRARRATGHSNSQWPDDPVVQRAARGRSCLVASVRRVSAGPRRRLQRAPGVPAGGETLRLAGAGSRRRPQRLLPSRQLRHFEAAGLGGRDGSCARHGARREAAHGVARRDGSPRRRPRLRPGGRARLGRSAVRRDLRRHRLDAHRPAGHSAVQTAGIGRERSVGGGVPRSAGARAGVAARRFRRARRGRHAGRRFAGVSRNVVRRARDFREGPASLRAHPWRRLRDLRSGSRSNRPPRPGNRRLPRARRSRRRQVEDGTPHRFHRSTHAAKRSTHEEMSRLLSRRVVLLGRGRPGFRRPNLSTVNDAGFPSRHDYGPSGARGRIHPWATRRPSSIASSAPGIATTPPTLPMAASVAPPAR